MKIIMVGEAAEHETTCAAAWPGRTRSSRCPGPPRLGRTTTSSRPTTWSSRCGGRARRATARRSGCCTCRAPGWTASTCRAAARRPGRERLRARDPDRGVRAGPPAGMGDPGRGHAGVVRPGGLGRSVPAPGAARRAARQDARDPRVRADRAGHRRAGAGLRRVSAWPSTTTPARRLVARAAGHGCRLLRRATTWCWPARSPRRPAGSSTPRPLAPDAGPRGAGQRVPRPDRRRGTRSTPRCATTSSAARSSTSGTATRPRPRTRRPGRDPFWELPNAWCTPHSSAWTHHCRVAGTPSSRTTSTGSCRGSRSATSFAP